MMNVLITIDTEVYPLCVSWRTDGLGKDIARDIYARTPHGEFGILYQSKMLQDHGLKAAFFVEPLFAEFAGLPVLAQIVDDIQKFGHEVQLHLHPEWLEWMPKPWLASGGRHLANQFWKEEQTVMIGRALAILRDAGAERICAFRAGDFAANAHTLDALRGNGIRCDTSYNMCYDQSMNDVGGLRGCRQPREIGGVQEFPVSVWRSFGRQFRHAQLCAASSEEMESAMQQAWKLEWRSFVIVSHSFELLAKRRRRPEAPVPDMVVVKRFERLCTFLDENRDKFHTCGFNDLETDRESWRPSPPEITVPIRHVVARAFQQAYRRVFA